jgi:hypothetical protein
MGSFRRTSDRTNTRNVGGFMQMVYFIKCAIGPMLGAGFNIGYQFPDQ